MAKPLFYMRYPGFLKKALTLSYDDGVKSDERLVQILDRHGIKCTFNLNFGTFGRGSRLSEEEVRALYFKGAHEIAVHGYRHLLPSALPAPLLLQEVMEDRKGLEALAGKPVTGMAYAYGDYDDRVMELLRTCGITYARTVVSTERFDLPADFLAWHPTCHHRNARLMEMAESFLQKKTDEPLLFYLWGHSYEFNEAHDNNWHVIEEFAAYMGGREEVFYATNGELCDYVRAYNALVFTVAGDRVYNPTATDVYLCFGGKDTVAKAGKVTSLV